MLQPELLDVLLRSSITLIFGRSQLLCLFQFLLITIDFSFPNLLYFLQGASLANRPASSAILG